MAWTLGTIQVFKSKVRKKGSGLIMKKFYIADPHLGHANVIRLSNRPFTTIDEMDEKLIQNWNNQVSNNDEIYIVGDLCYKSRNPVEYLERLNGKKFLIAGNHDGRILKDKKCRSYFEDIRDIMTIEDNGKMVILCHYPMAEWNGFFRGSIHLYGHIHNNVDNDAYKIMSKLENAYNVGCDILDYAPRALEDVIKYNSAFNRKAN
jgi:calcineurin-like phosphoesterase family protein